MEATYTLSQLITDIGTFVTGSVSWMTTIANFIVGNPLVLGMFLVGFVGIGIGLIRRMIG